MTGFEATSPDLKGSGLARRFAMLVAAFAFVLQSYIVQTHVHGVAHGFGISARHVPDPEKAPIDHGSTDCPLCQAVIHAGAFVAPAAPVLRPPFAWTAAAAVVITAFAASGASAHHWQSRAPPRF